MMKVLYRKALLKGERHMAKASTKKKYAYLTKTI